MFFVFVFFMAKLRPLRVLQPISSAGLITLCVGLVLLGPTHHLFTKGHVTSTKPNAGQNQNNQSCPDEDQLPLVSEAPPRAFSAHWSCDSWLAETDMRGRNTFLKDFCFDL